ncbi:hypothetical protein V6L80_18785 [Erwinia persicina]|uniref:hypothetical protein n=1 Tax=Erwinia persicina TaxID=55211 RepID=UPI0030D58822
MEEIWQKSWAASHIRQFLIRLEEGGLSAVDKWLDDSRNAHSLLMIIALQVRPEHPKGSAENMVGLLLGGNQVTPDSEPLARLHRPEMMHHTEADDFQYALKQSMDWVPVAASQVKSGFLVGVNPAWHMAIATGLQAIQSPYFMNKFSPVMSGGNTVHAVNTRAFLQQAVDHYPRRAAFSFTLVLPYRVTLADYHALILHFHTEVW